MSWVEKGSAGGGLLDVNYYAEEGEGKYLPVPAYERCCGSCWELPARGSDGIGFIGVGRKLFIRVVYIAHKNSRGS